MTTLTKPSVREAAKDLARVNRASEPAIIKVYLFPSDKEMRLIYVDPTTMPLGEGEQIAPFYFGASSLDPNPYAAYTAAIALILPDEAEKAKLPDDWGGWGDAEVLDEES